MLRDSDGGTPDVILIGTGSKTHVALGAGKQLAAEGIRAQVVSLPSWELFDRQAADYRESILPSDVRARVAVEAGTKLGWERYMGLDGFGASAPAPILYEKSGITAENVIAQAKALLGQ